MTPSIDINGTEREVDLTILPSGYGHNKIIANWFDGVNHHRHSIVTSDTMMTDAMRMEVFEEPEISEQESVMKRAAEMVIDDFNFKK